ncbi:hypothetical protein E2C01_016782 [Portunus trituberculatus]|uniref:Uncharacterized protein n=1 Tax=Portunus trituberculatus TaxID=210409 RepID=A0A5B7DPZ7_PORTR|nr:hypothetical protein [Portunus trituberculatus]
MSSRETVRRVMIYDKQQDRSRPSCGEIGAECGAVLASVAPGHRHLVQVNTAKGVLQEVTVACRRRCGRKGVTEAPAILREEPQHSEAHLCVSRRSPVCQQTLTCVLADPHLCVSRRSPVCQQTLTCVSADTHLYVSKRSPVCQQTLNCVSADAYLYVSKRSPTLTCIVRDDGTIPAEGGLAVLHQHGPVRQRHPLLNAHCGKGHTDVRGLVEALLGLSGGPELSGDINRG